MKLSIITLSLIAAISVPVFAADDMSTAVTGAAKDAATQAATRQNEQNNGNHGHAQHHDHADDTVNEGPSQTDCDRQGQSNDHQSDQRCGW